MFFRLIKPLWGRPTIIQKGEVVKNPDFIRKVDDSKENTIEGFFKDKNFIQSKNSEGYNVYFFPNHPSKNIYQEGVKYLSGRHIDTFKWVFADMDLKDGVYASKKEFLKKLNSFPIKPTMTVNSGNGIHVYWRIKDLDRDSYLKIQFGLINALNTDQSVWSVLQLMRYPNSFNTKKEDNFKAVKLIEKFSNVKAQYNKDQFLSFIQVTPDQEKKISRHIDMLEGKLQLNLENNEVPLDELPEKFINFMLFNFEETKGLGKAKNDKLFKMAEVAKELFDKPSERFKDRSKADFALASLLKRAGFSAEETLAVIANTQKANEKGPHRFEYAECTVSKIFINKEENTKESKFTSFSVKQRLDQGLVRKEEGKRVYGPAFFDCLETRWQKKHVMGLIGPSGGGKTTVALNIFKHMIQNNRNNQESFVFFSLEMPESEIIERWVALVGNDPEMCSRLYVIPNENEDGTPRNINLQDIVDFCEQIKKETGKGLNSVVIDHIGIIHNTIDLRRNPNFGADGSLLGVRNNQSVLSPADLCKHTKTLAKILDTFLIVLTQTTKEKGKGDVPIDKDGAYGAAQYEWMMDYVMTIWQPLMRMYDQTSLRILAWQYAKIRHKSNKDIMTTHRQNLLTYLTNGDLRPLNYNEYEEFESIIPQANEIRNQLKEKKDLKYYNSPFNQEVLESLKKIT